MRVLAGGIAVVTVGKDQDITGFTATSVASLSADPPRVCMCVNRSSASWAALQRYPHFGVNLLCEDHRTLADRFAGRDQLEGAQRYAGAKWTTLRTGTPLLHAALAALDCEVEESLQRHDHAIVIGRVVAVRVRTDGRPLVYWQGAYHPFEHVIGTRKAP
jgi:flavin reductase (DIM6/NTAB) family NADH-FMN oxidoreductase RutF